MSSSCEMKSFLCFWELYEAAFIWLSLIVSYQCYVLRTLSILRKRCLKYVDYYYWELLFKLTFSFYQENYHIINRGMTLSKCLIQTPTLTQQKEIYKEGDNTTTFLHQHPQEKQKYAYSSKCLQRKCSNVTTGYWYMLTSFQVEPFLSWSNIQLSFMATLYIVTFTMLIRYVVS